MGVGGDIGIHSKRDSRLPLQLGSPLCKSFQFRRAFEIEHQDVCLESGVHFRNRLADAREDDLSCDPTVRTQHPLQFATRDHIESATRSEEHTSELQSHLNLVCRLLLEKKKKK